MTRDEWTRQALNHYMADGQNHSNKTMNRVGMVLVMGFATFAAIASGAALPITLTSVLYAAGLFHRPF